MRPTRIVFSDSKDPFIAQALEEKYRLERMRHEEWKTRWEEDTRARARARARERELEELKRKHPRWGEFQKLSKPELQRLVWSKPVIQLAADFGVSDVAIGKRCKAEGIRKPPRGFWAKVESGKLSHPNGVPIKI